MCHPPAPPPTAPFPTPPHPFMRFFFVAAVVGAVGGGGGPSQLSPTTVTHLLRQLCNNA
jgi:hypothetical protein